MDGEMSSMDGEMSSMDGEVSSMDGEMPSMDRSVIYGCYPWITSMDEVKNGFFSVFYPWIIFFIHR